MRAQPNDWRFVRLGDALGLLIDHRGQTPGKLGGEFVGTGVPAISAIHIKNGRVDFAQRERYVTHEMYHRWMPEPLRAGDVLMTSEAPLGSLALVPSDAPLVLSQRLFALRGADGVLDNRYLRWFLESPDARQQIEERSSGSTVTGIRQAELRRVSVPLPTLGEQRRIVEILEDHISRLDAAERLLQTSQRRSDALGQLRLESLVTPDTPVARLADLSSHSGYGTSEKCVPDGPGPAVARIPNIVHGHVDMTDEKRAQDVKADLSNLMLEAGDLLIIRTNGSRDLIGRAAVVRGGVDASFASYLIRYQLKTDHVIPDWVYLMLERPSARQVIERLAASSAGQYNLSLSKLDQISIPVPPLEDQDRLVRHHSDLAVGLDRLRAEIDVAQRRSASLRRALLAAAFDGRLTGCSSDLERAEEAAVFPR